ncbi:DarT1-associated NADAR antitoxin family protein [Bacillus thuringiensis]|uniref:DarT1-associated NADAR antitoxin family protein n=1 Tax=Bacillus thuringiensis TaxID=1428 RepID=UPI0024BD4B61|nr:hypothetical protein [Bacillus thuringiensis]
MTIFYGVELVEGSGVVNELGKFKDIFPAIFTEEDVSEGTAKMDIEKAKELLMFVVGREKVEKKILREIENVGMLRGADVSPNVLQIRKLNVLECSTKGDKRFSALYAKVSVHGKFDSIENHYQKSKVFQDKNGTYYTCKKWESAKGKKPVACKIGNVILSIEYLSMFYELLWYKYLKNNEYLIDVLAKFDEYHDMFRSKKSMVCQADTIREYMKNENDEWYAKDERGKALLEKCKPINQALRIGKTDDKFKDIQIEVR